MKKLYCAVLAAIVLFGATVFSEVEIKIIPKNEAVAATPVIAESVKAHVHDEVFVKKSDDTSEHISVTPEKEARYIGNRNTRKFHKPSCHTLPQVHNRVYISERQEALDQKFVACKNCKP